MDESQISLLKNKQEMHVCFGWLLIFHFCELLNVLAENRSVLETAELRWASGRGSCVRKKRCMVVQRSVAFWKLPFEQFLSPVENVNEIGHS